MHVKLLLKPISFKNVEKITHKPHYIFMM